MDQQGFVQDWRAVFGQTPPLGYELRVDFSEMWTRFHSLPASKRYAETPDEHQIIQNRAAALISECFKKSQNLWLVVALSEDLLTSSTGAAAISRHSLAKALTWEDPRCDVQDRIPVTFFAGKSTGKTHEFDWVIDHIADEALRALIFGPHSGNVLAPYDGGFDIFIANPKELSRLDKAHPSWMSGRPDRL